MGHLISQKAPSPFNNQTKKTGFNEEPHQVTQPKIFHVKMDHKKKLIPVPAPTYRIFAHIDTQESESLKIEKSNLNVHEWS